MKLEYNNLLYRHIELLREHIDLLDSMEEINESEMENLNDALFDYQAILSIHKNHIDPRIQRHVRECDKITSKIRVKLDLPIRANQL